MAKSNLPNAILKNARIGFLNFAGAAKQYNDAGDRNFTIFLEPEIAEEMRNDGYNVKQLKRREDDDPNEPLQDILKVAVSYRIRAPKIFLVTSRGKTPIGEGEVSMLDWQDILKVDLSLNPSAWDVNGKTGIKAYLQSMYMTIQEDELDLEYADLDYRGGGQSAAIRFEEN